jgi:hypothetical protein
VIRQGRHANFRATAAYCKAGLNRSKKARAEAATSITSINEVMALINEVMAFRHVRQRVVWIGRDRAVGLAKYFCIVVGFRRSRSGGVL